MARLDRASNEPRDRGRFGQISLARPPAPSICNGIPRFCTLLKGLDARPMIYARWKVRPFDYAFLDVWKRKKKIVRSKLEFRFFNRNGDRFVFMRWARNIFNPWWYNARKICESRDPLLPHSLRLYNARGESFNVWRNFVQTPARETRKACLGAYRTEKVEKRVARY